MIFKSAGKCNPPSLAPLVRDLGLYTVNSQSLLILRALWQGLAWAVHAIPALSFQYFGILSDTRHRPEAAFITILHSWQAGIGVSQGFEFPWRSRFVRSVPWYLPSWYWLGYVCTSFPWGWPNDLRGPESSFNNSNPWRAHIELIWSWNAKGQPYKSLAKIAR